MAVPCAMKYMSEPSVPDIESGLDKSEATVPNSRKSNKPDPSLSAGNV